MVTHSGASARTNDLRALNLPHAITVVLEQGLPATLITRTSEARVMQIQDVWIVQDEWWREEIDRQYFAVLMMDGDLRTIYRDRIKDIWYEQSYQEPDVVR